MERPGCLDARRIANEQRDYYAIRIIKEHILARDWNEVYTHPVIKICEARLDCLPDEMLGCIVERLSFKDICKLKLNKSLRNVINQIVYRYRYILESIIYDMQDMFLQSMNHDRPTSLKFKVGTGCLKIIISRKPHILHHTLNYHPLYYKGDLSRAHISYHWHGCGNPYIARHIYSTLCDVTRKRVPLPSEMQIQSDYGMFEVIYNLLLHEPLNTLDHFEFKGIE